MVVIPGGGEFIGKRYKPLVIMSIIVVNVIVFIYTSIGYIPLLYSSQESIESLGFKPIYFFTDPVKALLSILTSMFVHADILHIFFNMYFLWIFGSRVEGIIGHGKIVALYFLSGLAAVLFHIAFTPIGGYDSLTIPAVGASGAISGVLGAYLLMFPYTRLSMCLFYFFVPLCFNLSASAFLIFWFAEQVIYGYFRLGGVAYFAHVGGFVMGLFLIPYLYRARARPPAYLENVLRYLHEYLGIQVMKPKALGRTAKIILIVLLLLITGGFLYSTFISSNTMVYQARVLTDGGAETFYISINPLEITPTPIMTEKVRIVTNRLIPLIYNETLSLSTVKWPRLDYTINIYGVQVPVTIINYTGLYDEHGVLVNASGVMHTISVRVSEGAATRGEELIASFIYKSSYIDTSPLAGLCVIAAALSIFAISSIIKSEEVAVYTVPPFPGTYPYL